MEPQLLHESSHEDVLMRVHCIAGLIHEEHNQRLDGAAGFILRRWLGKRMAARPRWQRAWRED